MATVDFPGGIQQWATLETTDAKSVWEWDAERRRKVAEATYRRQLAEMERNDALAAKEAAIAKLAEVGARSVTTNTTAWAMIAQMVGGRMPPDGGLPTKGVEKKLPEILPPTGRRKFSFED